jgi:hypothetical protein
MKRGFLGALLIGLIGAGSALAGPEPDNYVTTWVDLEYLNWWVSPNPLPQPLLTTGPEANPLVAGNGVLGAPGTQVLFGQNSVSQGVYPGFRVTAGSWLCDCPQLGVEASFFLLPQQSSNTTFSSDALGNPLLARPIIDALSGKPSAVLVSAPNAFAGSIDFRTSTQLLGAEANGVIPFSAFTYMVDSNCCTFFQFLGGFRYVNLQEDLGISQKSTILPSGIAFFDGAPVLSPGSLGINDDFRTLNQFFGGQVGVRGGIEWWRFTFYATAKEAIGTNWEEANIAGNTILNPGTPVAVTVPGGVYALASNMGRQSRNTFSFIQEGTATLSFAINAQIRLTVGYTILYWTDVARPGRLIDQSVNRTELPSSQAFIRGLGGPDHPSVPWNNTDFWAQGINIGLSLRF